MTASQNAHPEEESVALWATQGGGLAIWSEDREGPCYVWHTLPDWYEEMNITEKIGDPIPTDWSVAPANRWAVEEAHELDERDDVAIPDA